MDINNLWSEYNLNSKKQNSRCLSVNTILEGKYLVGPVLGQGGFGITYVGYDLNMESKIAIKEYFPVELVSRDTTTMHGDRVLSLSGEKSVTYKAGLKKYVAEAQNVSQFSEVPGVVSVKDFFYANETAYIVMEFIDGISLKDYLKEKGGRLTEEETLAIMKPILEALVQVHKSGIIHRDISPDNIMLTFKDGNAHNQIQSVKLIDFGAARMTEKNDQKSLTIILKHGYAPEEQYRTHGEQGPWTDVYALCAVLYRMLTGETPVPAMDRMFKDELKTLEQCGAKVSANTANAILKGLVVKKDDRIQSVQELIAALYEGAKIKPVKAVKSTESSGKKIPWIAGIGAVCVAAVVGGILLLSGDKAADTLVPEQENTVLAESIAEDISAEETRGEVANTEAVAGDTIEKVELTAEEELGEQIVFYDPQRSIASPRFGNNLFILICKPDGTVEARGNNNDGQCDVEDWDHVAVVEACETSSFGVRTDGTVLYSGVQNGFEQAALWTDIVDIQALRKGVIIGLKQDGTVVNTSYYDQSEVSDQAEEILVETNSWSGIKSIASSYDSGIYGLTEDGNVLVAGENPEFEITGWTDVVRLVVYDGCVYGICEDGTVKSDSGNAAPEGTFRFFDEGFGVFEDGTVYRQNANTPSELDAWNDLIAVGSPTYYADGPYYGLQSDGTILEYTWVEAEDISPAEMKNLKSVQSIPQPAKGETLFAITKNNEICKYGKVMGFDGVLDYSGVPCWYNGYAALYEDGTFLYTTDTEAYGRADGVAQVVEMFTHKWQPQNGTVYAYLLLMMDGTVQKIENGFNAPGVEYYVDVMEGYSEAETWTEIVQLEEGGYDVYGLKEDGSIVGVGNMMTPKQIRILEESKTSTYAQIGVSKYKSLFGLMQDGTLRVLFVNDTDEKRGLAAADGWNNVQAFSIGECHIAALLEDGTVKATGGNHCGQCDVEEWRDVVYLTTGKNCTLGITSDGELLMAGSLY